MEDSGHHIAIFEAPNRLGLDTGKLYSEVGRGVSVHPTRGGAAANVMCVFTDDRLRPHHRDVDGQKRALADRFQGICAYVLAGELAAAGGDHRAAFAAYEKEIRKFTTACQRVAGGAGSFFAPRSAGALRRRDQAEGLPRAGPRGMTAGPRGPAVTPPGPPARRAP